MSRCARPVAAFVIRLLLILVLAGLTTAAVAQDSFEVVTFRNEFVNWATVHEQDFSFPEPDLYESVLLHIDLACPGAPGDCDPWDRFANIRLRHWLNDEDSEVFEIARFITPYDITGGGGPETCSWTVDVSDYQFLLHDQVTLLLYIESWMGDDRGWLITARFEMTPGVPEREPFAIQRLWQSGSLIYGDPDNPAADHLQPVTLTVPAQASWATMKTYATGHGFLNTDNAAEFSRKFHEVHVGDNTVRHFLWRSDCASNRCSPQQGTWLYNRAGWCPGDKADPWLVDVSDWVSAGDDAVFGYGLQPYENWCRPNNPDCVSNASCECPGHAYFKFESQVVFYRTPNVAATDDGRLVPGVLHLVGNHPNPFNPETTIRYHVAEPGLVTVVIYDAQGGVVATEQVEHAAAGQYAWTWNGRSSQGARMPSGVYLYELQYGAERVSAKMLMLK